jgi:hypothetical protein
MSKVLRMVFQLEGTKTVTYSLADPKDGLKKADVAAVMDNMIARKAVLVRGVAPKTVKEIVVRSTEETELA